ncbi:Protein of unknown function DUF58 [Actinomyces denticolens]|uniref:DUF58 domain-containing protein n=1 Tax=Actinomyces denticolens TaxID=52767 RepID=A0ABY1IAY0_9ACTO|nr:DUF58 domain-containing protein [Actinomyces denticolens]SHI90636.1 Protein of unknown function DUF58 [Actinomyces denticolens]
MSRQSGAGAVELPAEPTQRGSRLARVRGRLSLPTLRRATGLLDGRHKSVLLGHGQDFDDLSAYRPGDDVGDIDWKASARIGQPVIKRYQRESNLPLVLAVDTGRTMAAQAPSGEDKRELALAVAEVMAYLARLRGDSVALVAGDASRMVSRPPRSGAEHAETILWLIARQYSALTEPPQGAPTSAQVRVGQVSPRRDSGAVIGELVPGAPASDLPGLLGKVISLHGRRSLVVLLTDTSHPDATAHDQLRRLSAQHELVVIQIADDAPITGDPGAVRDVEMAEDLPVFLRYDTALGAQLARADAARRAGVTALLDSRRIEHAVVASDESLVDSIAEVLGRQRLATARRRR